MAYSLDDRACKTRRTLKKGRTLAARKKTMAVKKRRSRVDKATPKERAQAEKLVKKLQEIPEVRAELVQRIKKQIAEGTYDTPERMEKAVEGMLRELFEEGDGGIFLE